jgi:stage II sporulation protein D
MHRPTLAALALGALLLGACDGRAPVGPTRASLDVEAAEVGPDSGELVLYPTDAVATDDGMGEAAAVPGLFLATTAAAQSIRIGVVQAAESITLGSAASYTVKDRAGGTTLLTGANGSVVVKLASVLTSNYRLQVMCGSVSAVNARKAAAEAKGYVTFTNFNTAANCTRLFIGSFATTASFAVRNAFRNEVIAAGLAANDSFWVIVSFGSTLFSVRQGATIKNNVDPVVITSSDGLVTINGLRYRNKGEARTNGAGTMAGVNELSVEEYLWGVVPRELGPVQYPEVEAQKAQAVAARTYALRGLGRRNADGYDLRATTDDQVYGGVAAEHPVSTGAVDDTRGVVMTHGGALIDALFSSTSGGHTADSEESFANTLAYLRGVPDAERGEAYAHVPTLEVFRAHANPQSLRALKEGDYESDWARFHRWTFEWTPDDIVGVLRTTLNQPSLTAVSEINVLSRGPSGRVLELEYVTDVGRFTVRKDAIRASLRSIDANGTRSNLPSTLFFVEPVKERGQLTGGFHVYGGGFGHGVGMGQTGAVGMAQKGHTFEEILEFYYQGIALDTKY